MEADQGGDHKICICAEEKRASGQKESNVFSCPFANAISHLLTAESIHHSASSKPNPGTVNAIAVQSSFEVSGSFTGVKTMSSQCSVVLGLVHSQTGTVFIHVLQGCEGVHHHLL